jgi:hypothetical protein
MFVEEMEHPVIVEGAFQRAGDYGADRARLFMDRIELEVATHRASRRMDKVRSERESEHAL